MSNWPSTLPKPTSEYSESRGVAILRVKPQHGPAKQRKIGSRVDTIRLQFIFTAAQLSTFETFVITTISGVKRFNMNHPRTGASMEFRIIPKDDGELYTITQTESLDYKIDIDLEILP